MKITVDKAALGRALRAVKPAVGKSKGNLPILSAVKLTVHSAGLEIQANDLDRAATVEVEGVSAGEPGQAVVVDHATLAKAVRASKVKQITLKTVGKVPDLGDSTRFVSLADLEPSALLLDGMALTLEHRLADWPDLWPDLPEIDGDGIDIPTDALMGAFLACEPAICKDDTRYNLLGVYYDPEGMLVSTDGHRLHCEPFDHKLSDEGIIIPSTVVALMKAAKASKALGPSVRFTRSSGSNIHIASGQFEVTARLVDGQFPPWRQVVPADDREATEATIHATALESAMDRCIAVVTKGREPGVQVEINGKLAFTPQDPDNPAARPIDVECTDRKGEDTSCGFNAAYLRDVAKVASDAEIRLSVGDNLVPGVFTWGNDSRRFHVVMPMKL